MHTDSSVVLFNSSGTCTYNGDCRLDSEYHNIRISYVCVLFFKQQIYNSTDCALSRGIAQSAVLSAYKIKKRLQ